MAKETESQRHWGRDIQKAESGDGRGASRPWQGWGGEREDTVVEVEIGSQGERGQTFPQRGRNRQWPDQAPRRRAGETNRHVSSRNGKGEECGRSRGEGCGPDEVGRS